MAKILVTGGAGFIGSHVVEALVAAGEKVVVLDNFSTGKRRNLKPVERSIRIVPGDLKSLPTVKRAMKGCDFVIHLAALSQPARSYHEPLPTHETNATGTLHALMAAHATGIARFVLTSSSAVYGESPILPKVETMAPNPVTPYGASKITAEQYGQVFYNAYRLETVVLRLFNVFGPRQDPGGEYAAVVPKFVQSLLAGKAPTVYGDGKQTRDFTYVADVVEAIRIACVTPKAEGEVFNIATGSRITILGLLSLLNQFLGKEVTPKFEAPRPADIRHSLADISKAQDILAYRPRVGIQEGLERTVEWCRRGR